MTAIFIEEFGCFSKTKLNKYFRIFVVVINSYVIPNLGKSKVYCNNKNKTKKKD